MQPSGARVRRAVRVVASPVAPSLLAARAPERRRVVSCSSVAIVAKRTCARASKCRRVQASGTAQTRLRALTRADSPLAETEFNSRSGRSPAGHVGARRLGRLPLGAVVRAPPVARGHRHAPRAALRAARPRAPQRDGRRTPKQEARAHATASRPSARRWPRKCRHQQRACSLAFALSQPVVPADEEGDAPASKRTPPRRTQTSVTGGGTCHGQKLQHERQFTRR